MVAPLLIMGVAAVIGWLGFALKPQTVQFAPSLIGGGITAAPAGGVGGVSAPAEAPGERISTNLVVAGIIVVAAIAAYGFTKRG